MKNISYIVITSLFLFSSCNNEYLEKYPLDEISNASFWNSFSDVEMYANQFYPHIGGWRYDTDSDDHVYNARHPYLWNEYAVPSTGGGWAKSDWLQIRRCNFALISIKAMEPNKLLQQYEGEIRFFKAFFYFQKIRLFGDVPWFETDLQVDSEELYKGRDSRKVVFANLVKDLDFAIANLPEQSADDRLTRYAALALKAEACLYEGTFRKYHGIGDYEAVLRESVSAAESIINSGLFSVYTTGNPDKDYFELFVKHELKGNPEGIMVERFLENIRMHNNVDMLAGMHAGYTKDFVRGYLCKDGLPISISPLYKGDSDFGDEFINRDPRMEQSMLTSERPYRIFPDGSVSYLSLPVWDLYCATSYYITKGYSPYATDLQTGRMIMDNFIFRYGKLLVGYAEAKAELGECTQEVLDKSINLLRDRVAMPHLKVEVGFVDPDWPDWEIPVSPLINEIRRERRIELCAEGSRWDDLVRWKAGKLIENPLTFLGARDPATKQYRVVYPGFSTRTWDDKLYFRPLPTQELVLNSGLTQNPGW